MRIHRIENPADGLGPFRSQALYGPWGAVNPTIERFWDRAAKTVPSPMDEAIREGKGELLDSMIPHPGLAKFGNASREALYKWVPKYALKELKKLGFVERTYEVPDDRALPLKHQVIYRHDSARLVDEAPLPA